MWIVVTSILRASLPRLAPISTVLRTGKIAEQKRFHRQAKSKVQVQFQQRLGMLLQ